MPTTPALSHEGAGRVVVRRVGLRGEEPTADASAAARADGGAAPWSAAVGEAADAEPAMLGPASLELRAEAVDDALLLFPTLRVHQAAPIAAVHIGLEWEHGSDRGLRFLQHGWHAGAPSGTHDLDAEAGGAPTRSPRHATDRQDWCSSDLVTVAGAAPRGPVCLLGVLENGSSFGRVHLRHRKPEGAAAHLELEVELVVAARLPAGAELALGVVQVALGTDSSRLLTRYGSDFGARAGARVWRPFLASADLPREPLAALTARELEDRIAGLLPPRDALPIDALVLRGAPGTSPGAWLDPGQVAAGLEPVARAMDAAGFIPGLRLAPFRASPEQPDAWQLPGEVLDLSRPEAIVDIEQRCAELCKAGFRYFELEGGVEAVLAALAADPQEPPATSLRRALEAVRRGAGEEAFLLGVDLPYGVGVGVVDAMRLVPTAGVGEPVADVVRSGMSRAWMHRRLFLGDASPGPGFEQRTRPEAEALAAVTATGGVVSVFQGEAALDDAARELLSTTILETLRIDRCGIPGTLRLVEPLASATAHGFTARDDSGVYRGWVNVGPEDVDRVAESDAELRIGAAGERAPGRRTIAASSGAIVHATVPHPIAVFCDFDGTFLVQDVGATLAVRYAPERREAAWARYQAGELTPWQYNMIILNDLPVPQEELETFLREEIQLDPGARDLLDFCQAHGLPFRILSDGFDWNIGRLQVLHGVSFDYEANRLHYQEGHWRIGAGAPNPGCSCGTGVCKAGVLQRHRVRHPDARLVHIGNGRVSDTCGAIEADQAFAKDSLAPELERRGEPFEPFETLHDVIPVLERMLPR